MATLQDLMSDKTQYPDETKLTLASGVETTLGELRKGHMMEADYRKKTAATAEEKRQLAQERASFEAAKLDAERNLREISAQILSRSREPQGPTELERELEANPVAKALAQQIKELSGKLEKVEQNSQALQNEIVSARQSAMTEQHRRVLAQLKAADPKLDEEELINFARQSYVPRLDLAYRLLTENTRTQAQIEAAVKKAKEEGIAEGKRLAITPTLPDRLGSVAPVLPQDAPHTFDEARDRAITDPEIIKILAEG